MKGNRDSHIRFAVTALVALLGFVASANAQQPLKVVITPQNVEIGSFYDGCSVSVTGELPSDAEIVVRVMGSRSDLHLKKKGKVFGLLWMNLDTLAFEDAPDVYMLYTSRPFEEFLGSSPESCTAWKLSLSCLEQEIKIKPETSDRKLLFQEFFALKESEGLYSIKQDRVRYLKTTSDRKTFEATLDIPPRVRPGQYNIEVYAIRDGNVIAQISEPIKVQLNGFPSVLSVLAFQHGAVFGVLATLVAIVAGLVMGFVFGGGKGGH